MASLIVTFGRHDGTLETISDSRTFELTIDGTERSTEVAASGDGVVTLYADGADCWFSGGKTANAENEVQRRVLLDGKEKRFAIRKGEFISVIQKV